MSGSPGTMPTVRTGYRDALPRRTRDRTRLWSFVVVRLTGLILTVLVLGHFGLTHIINDVAETDSAFIARRWGSALWVTWDWLMLATAIVHGASGVWVAIDDYTPDVAGRRRRQRMLLGISAVALSLGTITIVTATT